MITVIEAVIKTIPKGKKKWKKVKWLFEEDLQIAEKREAKGKGEKERHIHLNQSSKEKQKEIRKPSSVNSAKNRGKQ